MDARYINDRPAVVCLKETDRQRQRQRDRDRLTETERERNGIPIYIPGEREGN